jgi:RimJ/RimL family protein N-acetyltransferase
MNYQITARAARIKDGFFVYQLRNNANDQKYYGESGIEPLGHLRFWLKYWKDHTIYSLGEKKIGYSGIVKEDFRYAIIPQYRGQGYGKEIVRASLDRLTGKTVRVKRNNHASIRIFNSHGFTVTEEEEDWLLLELKS